MKRFIVLILAAVLILSCLVGCRSKSDTVSTDPDGMIEDTKETNSTVPKPTAGDTQRPSTEDTQTPSTQPSTQDSSVPNESTDGVASEGSETEPSREDTAGRNRRTRPLFR